MEQVTKDPTSIEWLPAIPWARKLNNSSTVIATSTWIFSDPSVVQEAVQINTTKQWTRVAVSGGSEGVQCLVTNTITTSDGQTLKYSFQLNIAPAE